MAKMSVIGFGGGCHWCTEAVFQSVIGVSKVEQGWISPAGKDFFSEGVLVHYDPLEVSLELLVAVHLHSHSSTADHAMREKYRSAVYVFNEVQGDQVMATMVRLKKDFAAPFVTQILGFGKFTLNSDEFLDYYATDSERPFCQRYIMPKLQMLTAKFHGRIKSLGEKEIDR
jgi:peptide-methionine (S)-S-oxide reductase